MRAIHWYLASSLGLAACGGRNVPASSPGARGYPALDAIREDDLKRDIFYLASDAMRGREAGTLDELRASTWLADQARAAGLEPAGDDGTYFQFWPMRRVRSSAASVIKLGDRQLTLGTDAIVTVPTNARLDAPIVFVGEGKASDVAGKELAGKVVAALISAPATPIPARMSLRAARYAFSAIGEQVAFLSSRNPAAIILVSDAVADSGWSFASMSLGRGQYGIDSVAPVRGIGTVPIIWVRQNFAELVSRPDQRLTAALVAESFLYPSVNVVARSPGTDPAVRGEYVLFSGHQDHDGVRLPIDGDSIYNGADDNASVSVGLLGIGRAFARHPGRRSALFVWHGAEERGLLGSRWHAAHPVVPRTSIVAVINADMIGGNTPDSAALLGVRPPHRNSKALVEMGLKANAEVSRFQLDTLWDQPTHPEGWYFRSDHLPYARAGIPSLYFTTLLHARYHTPKDEAAAIDIPKLARMTRWMYATGWLVANASSRPGLDEGFKLER